MSAAEIKKSYVVECRESVLLPGSQILKKRKNCGVRKKEEYGWRSGQRNRFQSCGSWVRIHHRVDPTLMGTCSNQLRKLKAV